MLVAEELFYYSSYRINNKTIGKRNEMSYEYIPYSTLTIEEIKQYSRTASTIYFPEKMFKIACLVACNRSRTWKHSCYVFRSKDVPSHLIIGDRAPLNQAHFLVKRSGEVLLGGTNTSTK